MFPYAVNSAGFGFSRFGLFLGLRGEVLSRIKTAMRRRRGNGKQNANK